MCTNCGPCRRCVAWYVPEPSDPALPMGWGWCRLGSAVGSRPTINTTTAFAEGEYGARILTGLKTAPEHRCSMFEE